MRAVVVHEFGAPDSLKVEQVVAPQPGPEEVLIDVRAVGVNFVDTLVITGKYQFLPARPFTPGKLPAGIITKVGSNVTGFVPGERVLTTAEHGGYAEQATALASQTYKIPDNMSFVDAASMALAFDTAWFALRERGRLRKGEKVLVLGATGAVGIAAIQLAKAFGAFVLGGVSSMEKKAPVMAAGADGVVNLGVDNIQDGLREQVYALTGGEGVDIVIDSLGDKFLPAALRAIAWRGRHVIVGFAAGQIASVKTNYLMLKNIELSGLQVSDYRKKTPDLMRECFNEIFQLYKDGALRAPASEMLPLEGFADALNQIRDRKAKSRLILVPERER
jgi:NADPH2:quinone reductase